MDQSGMSVDVAMEHGGRWSSLRGSNGREWLWHREAPDRFRVRPGDAFVDAGGLEECIPTIGGTPDHGDAWSRPWQPHGTGMTVTGDGYRLTRWIDTGSAVTARYLLEAEPGWRFIWAAHTMLDLAPGARIEAPHGGPMWVNSEPRTWPYDKETDLSVLGPDDGTTRMIVIPQLAEITVTDGQDSLTMRLEVEGQPCAMAIWRNLGGWPADAPYRNIAVEPIVGICPELELARDGETAVMPASGTLEWTLTVTA